MATTTMGPDWLHNPSGIDFIDSFLAPFFVAATFAMAGIATVGVDAPVTLYMSDVVYAISNGPSITVGAVVTLLAIGIAWATNQPDIMEPESPLEWVGPVFIIANLFYVLVPAFADLIASFWGFGFLMIGVNGAGFYLLAYK
ncbi:hypothetical protein [Haloarchaeobius iranensis]|nr:hypothetical protein [Haloarchaeobius iranensis]